MPGDATGVCCTGLAGLAALMFLLSWSTLAPLDMALKYNNVLQTVSPEVVSTPGIKFVGPFTSLVTYPKTIQTIQYDQSHRDLLDGRTKDGLPLVLGLSFQYRLLPDGLHKLYESFENNIGDYYNVYKLVGIHIVTEEATKFTAYQFFNEKQKIAEYMRQALDKYFQEHLFATVESLQLNEDDLPPEFTATILDAATSKQNITKMQKTLESKRIEFQTAVLVAEAQANVTVANAMGERNKILQNGRADAAIINAYVEAELQAYGKVHDEMGLTGDNLLKYIWYDTLSGGGVDSSSNGENAAMRNTEVLFGINPAAYISEDGGR